MQADDSEQAIGRRISEVFEERKIKLREVAAVFNISQAAVSNWRLGKNLPGGTRLSRLADYLEINVAWLIKGVGPKDLEHPKGAIFIEKPRGRLVPRVSLEDVADGRFEKTGDMGEVLSHFPCGPRSFEFTVRDSSNAPEFSVGDSIIIDPDLQPAPGDMVLAILAGERLPVFRRLHARGKGEHGAIVELVPSNPAWNAESIEIGVSGEIIGTMTEYAKPRRN